MERGERTTVGGGETRNLEIALSREAKPIVVTPKPVAKVNWDGWSKEGNDYVRKGGDRVILHSGHLPGTITFTAHLRKAGHLFRGGKLRWFVEDGDAVDLEAWARGETLYLPDGKAGLYPPVIAEGAASLLPDGPRPAVVFTVRIAADGAVKLDGGGGAIIQTPAQRA